LRLTDFIPFAVLLCYPGSHQAFSGLVSTHPTSRVYFVAILHGG
jgi:hypothetical protein